tara:strand:+ start:23 stop:388 length:366 start_codon:yes stop_codon:yes gene_type:complete
MKILIILIGLLLSASLLAGGFEIFRVGEKFIEFKVIKNAVISKNCSRSISKCDAYEYLDNPPKIKFQKEDFLGGKNPGVVICQKFNDTSISIGRDLNGNQQSFCVFKDGSMLSTGILIGLY